MRSLTGQRDTAKGDAQRTLKQLLHATGDVAPTAGGEIAATGADNALAFNPRDLRVQRSGLRREACDLTHGEAADALQTQSAARVDAPLAGAFTLRRARSPAHGQACAGGRACTHQRVWGRTRLRWLPRGRRTLQGGNPTACSWRR